MVSQVDTGHSQAEQKLNISAHFNKTADLCGVFFLINTTETFYFDFIFTWGDLSKIQMYLWEIPF